MTSLSSRQQRLALRRPDLPRSNGSGGVPRTRAGTIGGSSSGARAGAGGGQAGGTWIVPRIASRKPPRVDGWDGAVVWNLGAWWRWDGAQWQLIDRAASCTAWSDPAPLSPELEAIAQARLEASAGLPVVEQIGSGAVLFQVSRGAGIVVRTCAGGRGPSTLGELAPPPTPYVLQAHPRGDAGLDRSVRLAAERIWWDRLDPYVIEWVGAVLQGVDIGPRGRPDTRAIVMALFADVKRRAIFLPDPYDSELMGTTSEILCLDPDGVCMGAGDCDDMIIALGAGLMRAGIPVRLRVRQYAGQPQGHVTLMYGVVQRLAGQPPTVTWECIDPSLESGACSSAPYTRETILEVDKMGHKDATTFVGLGAPDGTMGDPPPPQLPDEEAAAWVGALSSARDSMTHAASRLRRASSAYAQVRSDLGLPQFDVAPAGEAATSSPLALYAQTGLWTADAAAAETKLLATCDFLAQAMTDGINGQRQLAIGGGGDLLVAAQPGDPYHVLLDANGVPAYFDGGTPQQEQGTLGIVPILIGIGIVGVVVVTLATAWAVVKVTEYLANEHHDDSIKAIEQQEAQLVAAGAKTPQQSQQTIAALTHLSEASKPPPPPATNWLLLGLTALGGALLGVAATRGVGAITRRAA